jgi:hypothetical protein
MFILFYAKEGQGGMTKEEAGIWLFFAMPPARRTMRDAAACSAPC